MLDNCFGGSFWGFFGGYFWSYFGGDDIWVDDFWSNDVIWSDAVWGNEFWGDDFWNDDFSGDAFVNSIFLSIFSARSIASKGKSDVKESTDSSTTLEDDDKGITITLTLRRGCENVFNYDHSQYWEWLLMETFSQPFHSVNGLLIKVSN